MRFDRAADAVVKVLIRSILGFPVPEIYDLLKTVQGSEQDLDKQIRESFEALSKSSQLVDVLGDMLKEREQKLLQLQEEYKRVSELSTLTQAQASAVASSLEKALGKSAIRERYISFAINIFSGLIIFIFGVFASDWVKGLFVYHR